MFYSIWGTSYIVKWIWYARGSYTRVGAVQVALGSQLGGLGGVRAALVGLYMHGAPGEIDCGMQVYKLNAFIK